MSDEAKPFEPQELRELGERAFAVARRTDDPSLRNSIALLGEAAMNLAAKLPRREPDAES